MEDAHFLHATHIIIIIRLHDGRNSLHPTVVLLIKVILLLVSQMGHSSLRELNIIMRTLMAHKGEQFSQLKNCTNC